MAAKQPFKPIQAKRAFEEICGQIRQQIQSGSLCAGDRLPSERDLAEQFEVSRATVREAFRALEISGILTLQKGVKGGAVVMQGNIKPITQSIEDLLSLGGLSLREYTEARVCVQREIIRLACERATEADFAKLAANIQELRDAGPSISTAERTRLTQVFYSSLAAATQNRAMTLVMSAFTEPLTVYLQKIGSDREWDVASSREKFLEHLKQRDAEAAISEMVSHMERLHAYLLLKSDMAKLPEASS